MKPTADLSAAVLIHLFWLIRQAKSACCMQREALAIGNAAGFKRRRGVDEEEVCCKLVPKDGRKAADTHVSANCFSSTVLRALQIYTEC